MREREESEFGGRQLDRLARLESNQKFQGVILDQLMESSRKQTEILADIRELVVAQNFMSKKISGLEDEQDNLRKEIKEVNDKIKFWSGALAIITVLLGLFNDAIMGIFKR
ncbi:hypothetical protein [Escherichia phage EP_H11]|nr:hypothetical protein [Escherichia phage EP_H11]